MPEASVAQPELPLQQPPASAKVAPSKAGRFEIPPDAEVSITQQPPQAKSAEVPKQGDTNTEDSAPSTPEGETPPEVKEELTPEQAAKREQRRAQNRLEKAYRQRAEAKARADFLEAELNKVRTAPPAALPVAGEPTLAQFDYDPEKYATAKAEFAKTQAAKELETKQQEASRKAATDALVASWEEKVDRGADKYDDFSTVVGELQPTNAFVAAIMDAENGEDVAYHLGKNPKEAERISRLPPLSQAREIGKLEAKLLAEPKKPKTPSKAPAPITPVTGNAAPTSTETKLESKEISDNEWMKLRRKQVAARRN